MSTKRTFTSVSSTTGTQAFISAFVPTVSANRFTVGSDAVPPGSKSVESAREKAVFAYLRGLRALGQTEISTDKIASALSLPLGDVERAVAALRHKGVKVAK